MVDIAVKLIIISIVLFLFSIVIYELLDYVEKNSKISEFIIKCAIAYVFASIIFASITICAQYI